MKDLIYLNSEYKNILKLSEKQFRKEKFLLQKELLKLQEWLLKNNKKLAVVFEGRDAAGKGSTIKKISENLMTRYFNIVELGPPTSQQNNSWFSTYKRLMPNEGEIVFFDRSWYSRAIIQPSMGYCTNAQYNYFMKKVVSWEEQMVKKEGLFLIKFYLSINKPTQLTRFNVRRTHQLKYWKLSDNDIESIEKWDVYSSYKERMFDKTSWNQAPWVIINSTNKMIAQLNCLRYVLDQFDYDGKIELKRKSWTASNQDRDLVFMDVYFENLTEDQYKLLSKLKQFL